MVAFLRWSRIIAHNGKGLAIVRDKIGLKVQFCTDGANAVSVFVNLRNKQMRNRIWRIESTKVESMTFSPHFVKPMLCAVFFNLALSLTYYIYWLCFS